MKDLDREIEQLDRDIDAADVMRDFARSKHKQIVITPLTDRVSELRTSYRKIDPATPRGMIELAMLQSAEAECEILIGICSNNANMRNDLDERRKILVNERQRLRDLPEERDGILPRKFLKQMENR
jgi:hypothetical protein